MTREQMDLLSAQLDHIRDNPRSGAHHDLRVKPLARWAPITGAPPVVGIDPGHGGALVLLSDGAPPQIADLPLRKGELDRPVVDELKVEERLVIWKQQHPALRVYMERSQSRTDDTPMTALGIGRGAGALIAIVRLVRLPLWIVPPPTWQDAMLIDAEPHPDAEPGKERAAGRALELWPAAPWPRRPRVRRLCDGPIDAALIAEYGRRRSRG